MLNSKSELHTCLLVGAFTWPLAENMVYGDLFKIIICLIYFINHIIEVICGGVTLTDMYLAYNLTRLHAYEFLLHIKSPAYLTHTCSCWHA